MLIPAFIQRALIAKVVGFLLGRLSLFKNNLNWDLISKDLEKIVRDWMPFEIFDDAAVVLANNTLVTIRSALENSETIGRILTLLANQEFTQAAKVLTDAVVSYLNDTTPRSMASLEMKAKFEDFIA